MAVHGRVYTIEGAQAALKTLPRELQREMREASQDIARDIADEADDRARSVGGVAGLMVGHIKARKDRYPVVQLGDERRLPTSGSGWSRRRAGRGQRVADLWRGAEFGGGSSRTPQLANHPHRGTRGYFFYPAVRDRQDEALERWLGALQNSLDKI
jgi:hypothetical protein